MNIIARPWEPQDLIDDLQMLIDEEPYNYLNFRRTTMCMARDYLKEHFAEPRWISVDERLPEAEKEVRVLCKASWNSKYRYQCQAFYEPKGMLGEESDYGWDYECCSEYSEEDDDYFVNPGWYERIHNWDDYSAVGIADEVTHWMPLPEPPEVEV